MKIKSIFLTGALGLSLIGNLFQFGYIKDLSDDFNTIRDVVNKMNNDCTIYKLFWVQDNVIDKINDSSVRNWVRESLDDIEEDCSKSLASQQTTRTRKQFIKYFTTGEE